MLPLSQPPRPRCDCCGTSINSQAGNFCPRCGYPVNMSQEEHFLEESIRNLQRVATYGGAQATVTSLLQRYQARLNVVRQQLYTASVGQNASPISRSEVVLSQPVAPDQSNSQVPNLANIPPHTSSTEHTPCGDNNKSFSFISRIVSRSSHFCYCWLCLCPLS